MELSQVSETFRELVDEPDKRFQRFFDYYCNVRLSPGFTADRYVRSGREMMRMANIYYKENDLFHAFVIYSRYVVLFFEKLKQHPQYRHIDRVELADVNKQAKEIAMPRAEQLKVRIKQLFANEAKEAAELKQRAGSRPGDESFRPSTSSSLADHEMSYDELKQKYNTLNERELQEIIAKNRETRDAGSSSSSGASPLPAQVGGGDGRPTIDRSLKPHLQLQQTNKYNLRTVIVPSDTTKKFLEIAEANTRRNVETCGILAGKLAQNKFIITHCIIPKQKGTSDTCSTEQEHELCAVIDEHNLITLGWIHTHPSQTAFLSSIDLHTHFGYQIMLPESIAIVCAPSYNEVGFFLLSPDYGMKEIGDCSTSGFHPHTTVPPLFENCDHIVMENRSSISIIDLRMISNRNI